MTMLNFLKQQLYIIWSQLVTLWLVFTHLFKKADTVEYPDVKPYMFPRWRGRAYPGQRARAAVHRHDGGRH